MCTVPCQPSVSLAAIDGEGKRYCQALRAPLSLLHPRGDVKAVRGNPTSQPGAGRVVPAMLCVAKRCSRDARELSIALRARSCASNCPAGAGQDGCSSRQLGGIVEVFISALVLSVKFPRGRILPKIPAGKRPPGLRLRVSAVSAPTRMDTCSWVRRSLILRLLVADMVLISTWRLWERWEQGLGLGLTHSWVQLLLWPR